MQKSIMPESPVKVLNGVGATREKQLAKLGIHSVRDLVYNFPRKYEERGNVLPLAYADEYNDYSFVLCISSAPKSIKLKSGITMTSFTACDDSAKAEIVFFNAPYIKTVFHIGETYRFYGKISSTKGKIQLKNPKYEIYDENTQLREFVPVYSLTDGVSSKFLEKVTRPALESYIPYIEDHLPEAIRTENELSTLSYALKNVHFPQDANALHIALRRLMFDEMFLFGIAISHAAKYKKTGGGFKFKPCDLSPLLNMLPYELTQSQKNAVNDIYKDTVIGENGIVSPMARIVVGDVGCGKTICAIIALYIAAKSGYQGTMMAPTEILARQHYHEISKLFSALGINVELLIGSTTAKEKKRIYTAIQNGECAVVVGTHALLSDNIEFSKLGLIITDEQHRFGVKQRSVLKDKTESAHMLVMSATPIPRTLALAFYGDLDITRITDMPVGRQRVETYVVNESYRDRLCDFIKKQVALGGQCYVVCPAIESIRTTESNESFILSNIKNVVEHTEILRQKLDGLNVECLHGKIKAKEKDEIMQRFSSGETAVLVSTTVIEVGVNVPNASLMIIENAERFGLAQLHQLRGRVGRGSKKSYCVLVSSSTSDNAIDRLETMRTTYNGFEIAEKDLEMRGPGDFFTSSEAGLRQSGGLEFKLASLCTDTKLTSLAFAAAKKLIESDPELRKPENAALRNAIQEQINQNNSIIS